jgi:S1-C subfamily serine protease
LAPAPDAGDTSAFDAYSQAVVHVVDTAGPAVVNLSVRTSRRGRWGRGRGHGAGSGVLVTPDGYLLTNSHVVEHADELEVTTGDGKKSRASFVGDDPATDLALVRIDGSALPYVPLEQAVRARQGQLAVAMGNPLGFESTVSAGVVSALGRSLRGRDGRLIDDVVQHTAPLNPGSSGGPLLDTRGRLLGVNTAIIAFSQGIGFAVPGPTAAFVAGELLAHRRVRRAWLGIGVQGRALDRRRARAHGLEQDGGVEVIDVQKNSPAERAGLRQGDLIVAFADRPVTGIDALHRRLHEHAPGREATVAVLRDDGRLVLPVVPIEQSS